MRYQVEFQIAVQVDGCANKEEAVKAARDTVLWDGANEYADLDDPIVVTPIDEQGDPI